ncbi:hypothetical protein PENTCL1PPCAC_2109 [Pristionchus entomophagus]|uniref:Uncharacterized protein n=1 Tax=Pristionchus entomophagus TaxID=358040 RepID=A0AAV5SEU4_9BILA|nr:hypothetical protein PENTCL1PPCAC_2109 [Pristionchus entomophagus]
MIPYKLRKELFLVIDFLSIFEYQSHLPTMRFPSLQNGLFLGSRGESKPCHRYIENFHNSSDWNGSRSEVLDVISTC